MKKESGGVTGIVIARNEEKDLPGCLDAWMGLCDRTVVIDNESSDDTRKIALSKGCSVYDFEMGAGGFAQLRNFALSKADTDRVLVFDADEMPDSDLREDILRVRRYDSDITVWRMKRRNYAFGRPLDHGRFAGDFQARLFPSDLRYDGIVHEQLALPEDVSICDLNGILEHFTYSSLAEYVLKMKDYSERVAQEVQRHQTSRVSQIAINAARMIVRRHAYKDGAVGLFMVLGDAVHDLNVRRMTRYNGYQQSISIDLEQFPTIASQ